MMVHLDRDGLDWEGDCAELRSAILEERIREKISDYAHYKFSVRQTRALNIFFDLAQEYEDICYLYHLPVEVFHFFFDAKAELYVMDTSGKFVLQTAKTAPCHPLPSLEDLASGPQPSAGWWFFPVRGRPDLLKKAGKESPEGPFVADQHSRSHGEILALFAVQPETPLTEHDKLFCVKFANRIGYSLHNRILALKSLQQVDFIRTVVHDIGHNVINTNLHSKLLLKQLNNKLSSLRELCNGLQEGDNEKEALFSSLCNELEGSYEDVSKQFHQSSFFIETLLRQSHFDQGRYVLHQTRFNIVDRVVTPQFERYGQRMLERGITIEPIACESPELFTVDADLGLISQVMANFFSNAVKYTRQTPGIPGLRVRCSLCLLKDYFGKGHDGIEVAVFSTGEAVALHEQEHLFSDSYRASNTEGERGSGHGLYFSRLILAQHEGQWGYRREKEGNVFYFVLPLYKGNTSFLND